MIKSELPAGDRDEESALTVESPAFERMAARLIALKNILGIPDLQERVLFTLALLIVYRIGRHIPTPGVNTETLSILAEQVRGTMFGLYDLYSGPNLSRVTIFALGVMPYIGSSIILQLLTVVSPYVERLSMEGEVGRRTITRYTWYLTPFFALVQSLGIAFFLERQTQIAGGLPLVYDPGWGFRMMCVLTMTTGTMFIMWLAEQITAHGIGNGMALIIVADIVVGFPTAALTTIEEILRGAIGLSALFALTIVMVFVIGAVVFIWRGQRRVTVQYARRVVGRRVYGSTGTHLPVRVNTSGVIPIVVASFFLDLLATAAAAFPVGGWGEVVRDNLQVGMPLYYLLFMGLVIVGTYFYAALTFNADDVAENLRKCDGSVPGIRAGKPTAEYIDTILMRNAFVWSICLALVAILPDLMIVGFRADAIPVIGNWLGTLLPGFIIDGPDVPFHVGGTSLLILVGVSMDTVQEVQAQLVRRPRQPGTGERSDGGSTLVETGPALSADVQYETFVPVFAPRGAAAVSCTESLLQSAGIRFFVKNELVQDLFGVGRVGTAFSVFTGAPAVFVEPTRAEEAAELLVGIEAEQLVGTVVHYFAKPQVGVVRLAADLKVGETLHFRGGGADFNQVVQSMQMDRRPVQSASAATDVAVKVDQRVRAGTQVYRVTPAEG